MLIEQHNWICGFHKARLQLDIKLCLVLQVIEESKLLTSLFYKDELQQLRSDLESLFSPFGPTVNMFKHPNMS